MSLILQRRTACVMSYRDTVQYCGYVCNMDPVKDPSQLRAKLNCQDQPLVAVMAGGGADAYRLMQTYLAALPFVNNVVRVTTVMVTGPFMPESQHRELREQAKRAWSPDPRIGRRLSQPPQRGRPGRQHGRLQHDE